MLRGVPRTARTVLARYGRRPAVAAAAVGLTIGVIGTTGCEPPSTDPVPPAAVASPSTTKTLLADPSWYLAPVNGTCPPSTRATFTQSAWDTWITNLLVASGTTNATRAPLRGTTVRFPAGCYYLDSTVELDRGHPLVDVALDGAYTADPAKRPQLIQLNDPRQAPDGGGDPMLRLGNVPAFTGVTTDRVSINGFVLQGSMPGGRPYQGGNSGGISLVMGVSNITIKGSTIHHIWGDAVYLAQVDRVLVKDNLMYTTTRDIMTQAGGSNVEVAGNTMLDTAGLVYNLETNQGSYSADTTYVHDNWGSHASSQSSSTMRGNGVLWNVTANPGTSVRNVRFSGNRSSTALVMWARAAGATGSLPAGSMDRIMFDGNTTTSGSGGMRSQGGTNITIRGNAITGKVTTTDSGLGYLWTYDPPWITIGVSPYLTPCGTATGNTYVDRAGATRPMPFMLQSDTSGTATSSFPSC